MLLSKYNSKNADTTKVVVPDESSFELPEKVLQFGTGVLLRGLPDYFIDKANRRGIFNGRIVVVKSTDSGDASAFEKQDNLYTLCIRGIENGEKIEENIICSAISRVLSAKGEWDSILACAHNPQMQIIISNTTEVGIQLIQDDIRKHPPVSFPGKLLAFLQERYNAFEGSHQSGMVIVPTELIPDNGQKLESIILELAHLNALDEKFIEWLENSNHFCNSLVDRIVPGKPDAATREIIQEQIGAVDELITMSEVYSLWAIEGDENVAAILNFAGADNGVIITPDINLYRELKLRMLNGTHILSSGIAFLSGIETVNEAMDNTILFNYIEHLMMQEIAPAIPYAIEIRQAKEFGKNVLERFANPFIRHQWISITLNYSAKLQMRIVPVLKNHYKVSASVPENIALGFAAYLFFMKAVRKEGENYFGISNGAEYKINDDKAAWYFDLWNSTKVPELVTHALQNTDLWGTDLSALPGFAAAVTDKLQLMIENGVMQALQPKKVLV